VTCELTNDCASCDVLVMGRCVTATCMIALNVSHWSVIVMVMVAAIFDESIGVCGSDDKEHGNDDGDGDGNESPSWNWRLIERPAKPLGRCVLGFMQKADSSSLEIERQMIWITNIKKSHQTQNNVYHTSHHTKYITQNTSHT
jgi:hypothetical protein